MHYIASYLIHRYPLAVVCRQLKGILWKEAEKEQHSSEFIPSLRAMGKALKCLRNKPGRETVNDVIVDPTDWDELNCSGPKRQGQEASRGWIQDRAEERFKDGENITQVQRQGGGFVRHDSYGKQS